MELLLLTLKAPGEEYQQANNNWLQNPWWAAYQITNENIRDRFITSADLRYNILDWLYISGQNRNGLLYKE